VRDGIALSKAGHPVVLLVHESFEVVAAAQAKALGFPDLKIHKFAQPQPEGTTVRETEEEKAVAAVDAVAKLLLA
jgi:hypothetical protein